MRLIEENRPGAIASLPAAAVMSLMVQESAQGRREALEFVSEWKKAQAERPDLAKLAQNPDQSAPKSAWPDVLDLEDQEESRRRVVAKKKQALSNMVKYSKLK
jgi:hypothetical protein